jgi:pimeloyl-ACP methyl ester carboxylesterase
MKRVLTALAISVLVLLVAISSTTASFSNSEPKLQNKPDSDNSHVARPVNTTSAPDTDDEHFVADTGGELDQYLFRTDGDGYIRFNIPITRYYFNEEDSQVTFDANGFLTESALGHLLNKHVLPDTATLRLRVWDVDEDESWCPEVDYIYVNDIPIYQNGYQSKLSGANDTWSTPSFQIPIEVLKFPTARGTNGNAPQAVDNEIAVQVDVLECCTWEGDPAWAVEVDWGVIEIPSLIRPIIFAHGWTGTTNSFDDFEKWLERDGIPSAGQVNLQRGIYPIADTATWLKDAIDVTAKEFGVDQLNIFAHSKGGLVTRKALRDSEVAENTEHIITFASPHHGTTVAEKWQWVLEKWCEQLGFSGDDVGRCARSTIEFRKDTMINGFNYSGCTKGQWPWSDWENCTPQYVKQSNVKYYSFAANGDEAVKPLRSTTYPWNADAVPFPDNINVNERFDVPNAWEWGGGDHSGILGEETAYKCAISYLDSDVYSSSSCPSNIQSTSSNQVSPTASVLAEDDYQIILSEAGTLTSGSSQTLTASLDSGTMAVFEVYSDEALVYTLTDPNGRSIDPSVANTDPNITYIIKDNGGVWLYQYQISTPETGNWKNVLKASSEVNYMLSNQTNSTVQLSYKTNQLTYQPGDLVTLETALSNGSTLYTSVTFTGSVTHPDDSTTTLTFYDDGSHSDTAPNDGIYTAQFTASSTNGHAIIALGATKGNVTRISESSIAIASQTAQFQHVTNEYPSDTDGNGLYNSLDLYISVNVVESGHFEFQGTLIDGAGQPVATGYHSTLMAGTGTLPTGLQTIVLSFDGSQIYQHGVNGPYTLANLTIFDVTGYALEVDTSTNIYTTTAYQVDQFERPMISLTSGSETPVDYDSNGRYDLLQINLNVNVIRSGNYEVNGRLIDPNGGEIAWSTTSFYASSSGSYLAQLEFDGHDIGRHEVDGPYTLQDLSIFNASDTSSALFGQVYETQAYAFTEFEGGYAHKVYLPITMRNYTPPNSADAYEPDDTAGQASLITSGESQEHSIVPVGDVDWVTFALGTMSGVILETNGASGDTRMWLYDDTLNQVEFNDDGGDGLFSYIDRTCSSDALPTGTYYVAIDEYGNNSEISAYTLSFTVISCP